jgi:hypothetical protein
MPDRRPSPEFMQTISEALAQPTQASTCGHGYKPRFCRVCHGEVCTFPHNGPRGNGCDDWKYHETCTGFTPGYETYRCDCICCCSYWPTAKPARIAAERTTRNA